MFDSSQIPYQGVLHATNQNATGGIPVQVSTGRLVAKGEEQSGNTTKPPQNRQHWRVGEGEGTICK